jgi:hypothetical protein
MVFLSLFKLLKIKKKQHLIAEAENYPCESLARSRVEGLGLSATLSVASP